MFATTTYHSHAVMQTNFQLWANCLDSMVFEFTGKNTKWKSSMWINLLLINKIGHLVEISYVRERNLHKNGLF